MDYRENDGFQFFYKNRRISRSEPIRDEDFDEIEPGKGNEDSLFIFCLDCGVYMDFKTGKTGCLDGKWTCPDCRRSVREATAYKQLDRENTAYLSEPYDPDDAYWDPF